MRMMVEAGGDKIDKYEKKRIVEAKHWQSLRAKGWFQFVIRTRERCLVTGRRKFQFDGVSMVRKARAS